MTGDKAGLLDIMGQERMRLGFEPTGWTPEAQAVFVLDAEVKKLVASREAIQPRSSKRRMRSPEPIGRPPTI